MADVIEIVVSGAAGEPGPGVPVGGSTGQALVKASGDDFDTEWTTINADPAGSSGQVQFNDGGSFGAASDFTWDKTQKVLAIVGQGAIPVQTLTDGANISWNTSAGAKAKVTLAGNRTVNAVTNAIEGASYSLWVIQDVVGGRTLSFTSSGAGSFDFGVDGAPTLTATPSRADLLGFEAISIGGTLKLRFVGIKKGFS